MQAKHYRFFGAVKELPADEINRLCNVDGYYSMAFVATLRHEGHDVEIGVGRYTPSSEADVREIAVTIADEWQHTGLDRKLAEHLIAAAKECGVRLIYSQNLADDPSMRELAQSIGMNVRRDPSNARQVIYSIPV